MSINLKVEEYCQDCPDFEPEKITVHIDVLDLNPISNSHEKRRVYNTTIECKHKKRCAAQMRYLQKQHDAMKKKETGDESNKV